MLILLMMVILAYLIIKCTRIVYEYYQHWIRVGVPNISTIPLLGNFGKQVLRRCSVGEQFLDLYNDRAGIDKPILGIFILQIPAILIRDTDLIKSILVQNFDSFTQRYSSTYMRKDAMKSLNLFFARHQTWNNIHDVFKPFFQTSNIQNIYTTLSQVGCKLENYLNALPLCSHYRSTDVDIGKLCTNFNLDLMISLLFGVDENNLPHLESLLLKKFKEIGKPQLYRQYGVYFAPIGNKLHWLHSKQDLKFFRQTINASIRSREQNLSNRRHDLIDFFINQKKTVLNNRVRFTNWIDVFIAQIAFLFTFHQPSWTILFALFELSKNELIQTRLRQELRVALQISPTLSYEQIVELKYLDMVVKEVLRLYPPITFIERCCTNSAGFSLEPWNSYVIPQGLAIYISVMGLHRDEGFWNEPKRFDPERFSPENEQYITPMSYLPFGDGPRACMGSKLSILQIKVGLISVLKNFYVATSHNTIRKMIFNPERISLSPANNVYLRFVQNKLYQ